MKKQRPRVPRFKIYVDSTSYCAETIQGKWRTLKFGKKTFSVSESDTRSKRFTKSTLMTREEIIENELDFLFSDCYYPKFILEEAKTLSEAARRLREEASYLEELEKKGWQLTSPVNGGYGEMECQLMPFKSDKNSSRNF